MTTTILLVISKMLGVIGALTPAGDAIVNHVNACEIQIHAKKHQSYRVELTGTIKAGLDQIILTDHYCRNMPILLVISNNISKKPNVNKLWTYIYRDGTIGTVGKNIAATVLGSYSYEKGRWPRGVIVVEDIVN